MMGTARSGDQGLSNGGVVVVITNAAPVFTWPDGTCTTGAVGTAAMALGLTDPLPTVLGSGAETSTVPGRTPLPGGRAAPDGKVSACALILRCRLYPTSRHGNTKSGRVWLRSGISPCSSLERSEGLGGTLAG